MKRTLCWYCILLVGCWSLLGIGGVGCKSQSSNPTAPDPVDDEPLEVTPTPTASPTPEREITPTPAKEGEGDGYGETPDDPDLETLEVGGSPYIIMMDYTGDIDWYKVRVPIHAETLEITLSDIPEKSDYDLIAYDASLIEMEDGRSAQSGNVTETLSLSPSDSMIYLQVYSYTGRGEALLSLTIADEEDESEEEPEVTAQLTFEEVLSTYYPLYPRGNTSGLLERSVETQAVGAITCQTPDTTLSGELTIGNYSHVERELLESVDYVDGWAVVVFNGSPELLETLNLTIRVSVFAPELDLTVEAPPEMDIEGDDYLVSDTRNDVYYLAQTYGDFFGNTMGDLRISSGVVGDIGDLFTNNVFTQEVEVEWEIVPDSGMTCSGRARGEKIVDFEIGNFSVSPRAEKFRAMRSAAYSGH
jgi:hypothetical protein